VSVVTVREALRGLEAFGIIQKKRGKSGGIFVIEIEKGIAKNAVQYFLSSKNFSARNLGDAREIVEPPAVRLAASCITPVELKGLEANIRYCESKLKKRGHIFSEKDFFEIEERNVEFHRLIGEATHNPILALTIDYLEDFLLSFKKRVLKPDIQFTQETIKSHRQIYDDLRNRDGDTAERDMLAHIRSVEVYLATKER
jgi:GntR family transcriptional repressor for pyruvate dehydrogenase complex